LFYLAIPSRYCLGKTIRRFVFALRKYWSNGAYSWHSSGHAMAQRDEDAAIKKAIYEFLEIHFNEVIELW
jgi:hypothetical protein